MLKWEKENYNSVSKYTLYIRGYNIEINDWSNNGYGIFIHITNEECKYVYSQQSKYVNINDSKKEALQKIENHLYQIMVKHQSKYEKFKEIIKNI